jgi:hypothetical protein
MTSVWRSFAASAAKEPRLRALLERVRVVAEEKVDLPAAGEALQGRPLARGGPMPVATRGGANSDLRRRALRHGTAAE